MTVCIPLLAAAATGLDLSLPADNCEAFLRTRCSLDCTEVFFHWRGDIYSIVPGEPSELLFLGEGFNVARLEPVENGYMMLSREVFLYRDPDTGEILDSWENPFTGETVRVVHVLNDPVNSVIPRTLGDRGFSVPCTILEDGTVAWDLDILLFYPSPLPRDSFPLYSGSDMYQGCEMFQFFTTLDALEDTSSASVPCHISWTRAGPWLPWMRMADRPGWLLYHCTGGKIASWEAMPPEIRQWVESGHPEFAHAPSEYTRPNSTSWSYFRELLESGELER
ncbi:DUF1838 family protein [Candidatus Fermentibacteria bacterium]|nr:DUF1838 family protein [Candidatus Fermentibacteria bacterium]